VAKDVGISLGNLQYYFRTREDLLEALFRAESDSDAELFASLCAREQTPRDKLATVTRAFVSRWTDPTAMTSHKVVWRALRFVSLQSPQFRALRHQLWERFYEQLSSMLRELQPGATADQLLLKAVLITAIIDGTSMMPPQTFENLRGLRRPSYDDEVVAAVLWMAES
jgi:AcrR family transcriptional regulator